MAVCVRARVRVRVRVRVFFPSFVRWRAKRVTTISPPSHASHAFINHVGRGGERKKRAQRGGRCRPGCARDCLLRSGRRSGHSPLPAARPPLPARPPARPRLGEHRWPGRCTEAD